MLTSFASIAKANLGAVTISFWLMLTSFASIAKANLGAVTISFWLMLMSRPDIVKARTSVTIELVASAFNAVIVKLSVEMNCFSTTATGNDVIVKLNVPTFTPSLIFAGRPFIVKERGEMNCFSFTFTSNEFCVNVNAGIEIFSTPFTLASKPLITNDSATTSINVDSIG